MAPPEGGLREPLAVMLNQIRPIDRPRMATCLGALSRGTMCRVDEALRIRVGLIDV